MKHLEDTPWWICDPEDTNYVAYSDTDSIYIHAEPLLKHLYPDFNEMTILYQKDVYRKSFHKVTPIGARMDCQISLDRSI